jgi:predicted DNA-binding transcriptional regulator YafY
MPTRSQRHPRLLELLALGNSDHDFESLATSLKVSIKTVRRDVDDLRKLGFSIIERGASHERKTLSLDNRASVPFKLTYDEAFALVLHRLGNRSIDGTFFGQSARKAYEKIENSLGPIERDYIRRMLPRVRRNAVGGDYSKHSEVVEALTLGIEDSRCIEIVYQSPRSTEPTRYPIHPYGLVEHRGTLYVVGYSVQHQEVRTWKIDRMISAQMTQNPFQISSDFEINQYFEGAFAIYRGTTPTKVTVRFHGSATRYVKEKRMHPSQTIEVENDGTVLVHFQLSTLEEVRSWILSFGASAEVIAPELLKTQISDEISRMHRYYNNP